MTDLLDMGWLPEQARALLPVLFDLTIKGVLLLALAGLVTTTFKKLSAATRHLVWCLAVCSVLALPVLSVTLPAWQVAAFSNIPYLDTVTNSLHGETTASGQGTATATPIASTASTDASPSLTSEASVSGRVIERASLPFYEAYLNVFRRIFAALQAAHWSVWLLMVWMGGVVLVMLRFSIGATGVAWLAFRARRITDPEWLDLVEDSSRRIGLNRPVKLLRSTRTAMPMTWGLWRSVVLLPISADDWSEGRRRCVITHELAHVKRWDCLTQTLAQFASAISWFNPLVWIAARAMREEREKACDDLVLDGGIRPSHYAAHLLDIARSTRTTLLMPLGAVSMARPSQLETRVLSILDGQKSRSRLGTVSTGFGMALTALLVLPLAALRPGGEADHFAFKPIATQHGDAYRWAGTMQEGQTLSIRGVRGDVQATPSKNKEVEVIALTDAMTLPVQILQDEQGLVVCIPSATDAGVCAQDDAHEIDFLVRVPAGVRFSGSTLSGDVKAVALQSDVDAVTTQGDIFAQTTGTVRAATVDGDVELRTTHFGQASTVNGDIHAQIGKTIWQGTLPFSSVNGDIIVELPAETHTDIDLQVEAAGHLQTSLPLEHRSNTGGERFSGTFGRGGRQLSLHTVDGDITVTYAGTEPVRTHEVYAVRPSQRAERTEPRYYARTEPAPPAEPGPQHENEEVRLQAIHALLARDDGNTVPGLSHALLNDRSERVRAKAAWALGEYDCGEALPALMLALKDESEAVRSTAVTALEALDNSKAVQALAEALQAEPSPKIRRQLVQTLGELDDARAIESLHLALRDDDARVRRAAKRVLAETFDIAAWDANEQEHEHEADVAINSAEVAPQILHLQVEGDRKMAISDALVGKLKRALAEWHLDMRDTDMEVLLVDLADDDPKPFARQMRRLGFKDATDEELLVARIFGLDDSYVQSIRDAGYCPTLEEFVHLKTAGIDRAFLKKLEKEGRTDLSVGELVALRHSTTAHTTRRTIEIEASLPPAAEDYGLSSGPNPGSRQRQ